MEKIRVSIYIEDYVLEVLKTFGQLDDVVNKILDCTQHTVDLATLPVAPPPKNCRRVEVIITNESYLQMSEILGRRSKKLSLRRLLYWFVNNEQYNDYGFEPSEQVDHRKNKYYTRVQDIYRFVNLLERYYCTPETCDNLRKGLDKVLEELQ